MVKPILSLITKYTDDIIGLNVRSWTKPTSLSGLKYLPKAPHDTFKLNSPSFEQIIRNLDLKGSIKPECLVGEGGEGAVYKILNSNFVLKVPHIESGMQGQILRGKEIDVSKLDFNVSIQDKINHIVAYCEDATIMKYISGINTRSPKCVTEQEQLISLIDNLDAKSIKTFFMDINYANKQGMKLDFAGNNCIINTMNGKLTPFDFGLGQDKRLLTGFMSQVCTVNLTATQQNNLLKKGTINLLELIQEDKISIKDCSFSLVEDGISSFKDRSFLEKVQKVINKIQNNSSKIDIQNAIDELKNINSIASVNVPSEILETVKLLEKEILSTKNLIEKDKLQRSLNAIYKHIDSYYT